MNFDPLLELAIQRVQDGEQQEPDPAPFRRTSLTVVGELQPDHPVVYHLHEWIDPDRFRGFVLTQAQYFEMFQSEDKHPNRMVTHTGRRAVGLSQNVDPSIQEVTCPAQKFAAAPEAADVVEEIRQAALIAWKECEPATQGAASQSL